MVYGVVDSLHHLLVPILAVLSSEQDVVDVHRAVELLGPELRWECFTQYMVEQY